MVSLKALQRANYDDISPLARCKNSNLFSANTLSSGEKWATFPLLSRRLWGPSMRWATCCNWSTPDVCGRCPLWAGCLRRACFRTEPHHHLAVISSPNYLHSVSSLLSLSFIPPTVPSSHFPLSQPPFLLDPHSLHAAPSYLFHPTSNPSELTRAKVLTGLPRGETRAPSSLVGPRVSRDAVWELRSWVAHSWGGPPSSSLSVRVRRPNLLWLRLSNVESYSCVHTERVFYLCNNNVEFLIQITVSNLEGGGTTVKMMNGFKTFAMSTWE